MKESKTRTTRWALGILLLALVMGCSGSSSGGEAIFQHDFVSSAVPWTHERFDEKDGKFSFAIVGDLNGGERPAIFEVAIEQLTALRPDLILSVGDLIDGGSEDVESLHAEWDFFDERALRSPVPLFRVGGNHDLTAQALRDVWIERHGALYYHFIYNDVLFLVLDTEDYTPERRIEIRDARNAASELTGEELAQSSYYEMPERQTGNIGPEQSAYFQEVIAAHPEVRWTMLFMHKPVWTREDEPDFVSIETALSDRPYSVFGGHYHIFSHEVRNGRDYTQLSTTGGSQNPSSDMAFDHVTLVTMSEDGPSVAHLRLDGILDQSGHVPAGGDDLCFQASRCGSQR